jgi:hypothetical protein
MIVESNNQKYHVRWYYYPEAKFPLQPGAVCIVQTIDSDGGVGRLTLFGEAYTSKKDIFNKKIGRKVSFADVLLQFPKEERLTFWKAFFEMQHKDYLKEE